MKKIRQIQYFSLATFNGIPCKCSGDADSFESLSHFGSEGDSTAQLRDGRLHNNFEASLVG